MDCDWSILKVCNFEGVLSVKWYFWYCKLGINWLQIRHQLGFFRYWGLMRWYLYLKIAVQLLLWLLWTNRENIHWSGRNNQKHSRISFPEIQSIQLRSELWLAALEPQLDSTILHIFTQSHHLTGPDSMAPVEFIFWNRRGFRTSFPGKRFLKSRIYWDFWHSSLFLGCFWGGFLVLGRFGCVLWSR